MKILNGFLNKRMGGLYHFCQVIGTYKKTAAGQKAVQPNVTVPSAAGRRDFVLQRKIWFTASCKFWLGGAEITLKDITELPPTQVCLRQTCINCRERSLQPAKYVSYNETVSPA